MPGGLYQNLAPHPLSVALDLLPQPSVSQAQAHRSRLVQHQPTDELRFMLESGNSGGLVSVSLVGAPRFQYMTVYGTKMAVTVDFLNKWMICQRSLRGIPKPISRAITNLQHGTTVLWKTFTGMVKVLCKRWSPYEGMDLLIREYYAALQEGREPPVTAEEGIAVMEIMDRVWEIIGPQTAEAVKAKAARGMASVTQERE
jgi:predicted dehydrogenase